MGEYSEQNFARVHEWRRTLAVFAHEWRFQTECARAYEWRFQTVRVHDWKFQTSLVHGWRFQTVLVHGWRFQAARAHEWRFQADFLEKTPLNRLSFHGWIVNKCMSA